MSLLFVTFSPSQVPCLQLLPNTHTLKLIASSSLIIIVMCVCVYACLHMYKYINTSLWVCFYLLCVYDCRADHFLLDSPLVGSSMGQISSFSLRSHHHACSSLLHHVILGDVPPSDLAYLLILLFYRSCSCIHFFERLPGTLVLKILTSSMMFPES